MRKSMSNSKNTAKCRLLTQKRIGSLENLSHKDKQKALAYMDNGDVASLCKLYDLYEEFL